MTVIRLCVLHYKPTKKLSLHSFGTVSVLIKLYKVNRLWNSCRSIASTQHIHIPSQTVIPIPIHIRWGPPATTCPDSQKVSELFRILARSSLWEIAPDWEG